MVTIAHATHWALGMLEATPVAIAVAVVGWRAWTDRRAAAPAGAGLGETPHA
jgi:hypothetical protein